MRKPKIGITIGDINGISPEILIKALQSKDILKRCTPIIYGSSKVMAYYKNIVDSQFRFSSINEIERARDGEVNVLNLSDIDINIDIGSPTAEAGKFALMSIDCCIEDAQNGKIDAIVTAPINKKSMKMGGFNAVGHTEHLTKAFNVETSLMLMVTDYVRIGTITNHIPISDVSKSLTRELILDKVKVFNKTLREDFGIEKPIIAVLGLNPHAGDGSLIGTEDEEIIRPAIIEAKRSGDVFVTGPHPADGFFASGNFSKVDGILSMYHDQGLIPFKLLSDKEGVNFTAGLPIVRTSPDHGTAYEIAGKNLAKAGSMRHAILKAIDISNQRAQHKSNHANPLEKKAKRLDRKA